VVTVHGIGFQQPPKNGNPGYADALHENLRQELGDRLGEDPERTESGGPVYVQSEWEGSPADGLARLGKPLVHNDGQIAHVALVYSGSEPLEPRLGDTVESLARAAISHAHYTSALGAMRLLLSDAWAAMHEHAPVDARSTLTPRTDDALAHVHHGILGHAFHRGRHPGAADPAPAASATPGAFGMLRALQDDVATYVARNDVRERVRGFVEDALMMLLKRDDVTGIVINAHSQGTVLCWDVLGRLPFSSWPAERAGLFHHFVTAGSPIRKYVDMFSWGERVGELASALDASGSLVWHNFFDAHDPVADPLNPPAAWRPGDDWKTPPDPEGGLLVARDPDGKTRHVTIRDKEVNNVDNSSGGGLQAHDYWNNQTEFVRELALLLKQPDVKSPAGAETLPAPS
jgi:hypothetical protein